MLHTMVLHYLLWWRPAVLSGLCSSLVAGGFARLRVALLFAVRCLFAASTADCRATCALFRALCEFVLLFCFESVLLSCSNSPSWPSRSRCLVSVVTHTLHQSLRSTQTRLFCPTCASGWSHSKSNEQSQKVLLAQSVLASMSTMIPLELHTCAMLQSC